MNDLLSDFNLDRFWVGSMAALITFTVPAVALILTLTVVATLVIVGYGLLLGYFQ